MKDLNWNISMYRKNRSSRNRRSEWSWLTARWLADDDQVSLIAEAAQVWMVAGGRAEWASWRFSWWRPAGAQAQCRSGGQLYPNPTRKNYSFQWWTVMWLDSRPSILTCKLKTSLLDLCQWVSVNNEQLSYRTHLCVVLSGRKHILALWHFIFTFSDFLSLLRTDLSDNKWSN